MMEDFIMKPVYPAARALPTYENLLLEMVEPNILKVTLNRPKATTPCPTTWCVS